MPETVSRADVRSIHHCVMLRTINGVARYPACVTTRRVGGGLDHTFGRAPIVTAAARAAV